MPTLKQQKNSYYRPRTYRQPDAESSNLIRKHSLRAQPDTPPSLWVLPASLLLMLRLHNRVGLFRPGVLLRRMFLVALNVTIPLLAPGFHAKRCARIPTVNMPTSRALFNAVGKVNHPRFAGIGPAVNIVAGNTSHILLPDELVMELAEGIVAAHHLGLIVAGPAKSVAGGNITVCGLARNRIRPFQQRPILRTMRIMTMTARIGT